MNNGRLGDDSSAGSLTLGDDGIVGNSGASVVAGGGKAAGIFGVPPAPVYRTTAPVSSVFSHAIGDVTEREAGGNDRGDDGGGDRGDGGAGPGGDGLGTGPQ